MIVVVTENVPNRLRGYLARWFVEVRAGVFIGDYNVKIRERIWLVIRDNYGDGNVVLAWSVKGDTGFDFLTIGKNARRKISFEGMDLVSYHPAS